ncbi:efflux RND transporter permease subunit [Streptomyces nymphaeiformis]|uniref:Cu/Ag efflux pump CusA n=1 Tax=Streptomyces nymphaeiformis TaxID=2663842 RepID=A0A7W7XEJ3_9ACTN|nr:efflux RND transporter permease subunit [Streptomyces nymphaeiformis]MBB4984481.1 Cu/Ag efflux pump CusA [Streptomyces nymphaeiformis]
MAAAVMALGFIHLPKAASTDVFPEFAPTQVQIQTEAPGLSAAEVEQLITVPLEQDLLNGVAWLDEITSESAPGLSSVNLVFGPGTNEQKARQAVQERLIQVGGLPQVGKPPVMIQPLSSTSRVMMIGLSSKDVSRIDMSVLARWNIKPRLLGIPGVANVVIWGERDRQLQVQIDPQQLASRGVSLDQVVRTTGNALWVSPLTFVEASTPGTGGFIDTPSQRLAIQHVLPITKAQDLASVAVEDTASKQLRIGDVATVVEDHQPLIGDVMLSDGPGIMLVVEKYPDANTREVTHAVEEAMNSLQPGLSGITVDTHVYRPASFVDTALDNVGLWVLVAVPAVSVLLGLYFLSWRVALISLVSITMAEITALWVLYLQGSTFNMMVLAGLAIALGAVIDDIVIGFDRIQRQFEREGRRSGERRSVSDVVVDATAAVRRPVFFATLILLLAVVPVVFLNGVGGAFARPLALSYVLAVLASTVVALTLTPVLAALLLARTRLGHPRNPLLGVLHRGFDRISPKTVLRPGRALVAAGVLVAAGFAVWPQLDGASPIPALHQRELLIQVEAPPGTSLPEMDRLGQAAVDQLRALPGVESVGAHVGRARESDQVVNVNSGEFWVNLKSSADYGRTVAAINRTMHDQTGLDSDVVTYPQARLDEVRAEDGAGPPVVVRVYGNDLGVLRHQAEQVSKVLAQVPGVVRPQVPAVAEEPTIEVKVDLAAAQSHGVKPGDVRRTAATYFSGLPVGSLYEEQKVFDVVVWGSPGTRSAPQKVHDLLIDTPNGGHVRLGDIATVRVTPYPTVIEHDATSRSLDVVADVSGRDLNSVLDDVRNRVQAMPMPYEFHAEVQSDVAHQQGQDLRIAGLVAAALLGAFLLLQSAFGSWRAATLVLFALPLAGVGGVLTAFAVDGVTSIGALGGFLVVVGIAVRNLVLLIRGYQETEPREDGTADPRRIVDATRDRVGPVLLTALATAVAVLPAVFLGTVEGMEVLHPLAVVVLGGLVTSTLVTLFIVPALYIRFFSTPGGREQRRTGPEPDLSTAGPAPDVTATDDGRTERREERREAPRGGPGRRRTGRRWAVGLSTAGLLLAGGAGLTACGDSHSSSASAAEHSEQPPAEIEQVPEGKIPRLTLAEDTAARIHITTEPLRQAPLDGTGPPQTLIPLKAVVYDPEGKTFAFTNPKPFVYVRTPVELGKFGKDDAVVKSGLPKGTPVVTVGAAELLGIEYKTDGEH